MENDKQQNPPQVDKKHFIVCYKANTDKGQIAGTVNAWTIEPYLNYLGLQQVIRDLNPQAKMLNIAITSLIELTEIEYECWTKGGPNAYKPLKKID